jgi:hypothetical protein
MHCFNMLSLEMIEMGESTPTGASEQKDTKDTYPIPAAAAVVFSAATGPNFRGRDNLIGRS